MIIPCLRRTVVATLFCLPLVSAAHAAGQASPSDQPAVPAAAAAPDTPVKPKLLRAGEAAMLEVMDVLESGPHLGRSLERLATYQFKPETARLLEETIGTAQPFRIERLGKRDGKEGFRLVMPAREHTSGDGAHISWSESPGDLWVDKTGRGLTSTGTWAALDVQTKGMAIAVRDMRTAADQRLGQGKLWFGTAQFDVGHLELQMPQPGQPNQPGPPGAPVTVVMDDLSFTGRTIERPGTIDIVHRMRFGSIKVADEQVSNLIMNYRLNQIDKKSAIDMTAREREIKTGGRQQEAADLLAVLRDLARASSKAGTALTIERISADYGGHTLTLQGRVALKGAKESDFDDMAQLFKHVDARFDIAVPVGLIRAGALSATRRQMAATGNAAQDPAPMAQTMTDAVIGKLLGEGFAKLDKGVLRATITVRAGKIRVNGKEVSLPTPPQLQAAPGAAPLPAMPARQISGSCTMPEFPADVIAKDAPLMLTLRVQVDETGTPGQIALAAPSAYPDYDRQVLAAQASCRFIPALQGDTPVAQGVTVRIARDPGTTRP